MADILIRNVSDAVASALKARADAEGLSQQQFLVRELERLAVVNAPRAQVTLDLRYPQAPRLRWGALHCEALRLRAENGATATLNAYGTGGGQKMTREMVDAKRRAGDYINKARVLGSEDIGVDIVALLEEAGWEVFPS